MGKILGIDHGSVRIGIALSDDSALIAFGREVILNDKNFIGKLKKIVSDENVTQIIIGYPLSLKGNKTKQTEAVESFEDLLRSSFAITPFENITISRWDERFTSKMAADSLIESGMKKKKRRDKSNLDIVSASLMLQSYLDSIKTNPDL